MNPDTTAKACEPQVWDLLTQRAALIRALLHFTVRAVNAEAALAKIAVAVTETYPRIGISDRSRSHV
jgi:hypothetical protein